VQIVVLLKRLGQLTAYSNPSSTKEAGPNDENAVTAMSLSLQSWSLLVSELVNRKIQIPLNEVRVVLNL